MYPKAIERGLQTVRFFAENLTVQFVERFKDDLEIPSCNDRMKLIRSEEELFRIADIR